MTTHDLTLDKVGCIVDRNNRCVVESHYREMTLPERAEIDIKNLRNGAKTSQIIIMHPETATRLADLLQELLDDNIAFEKKVNEMERAVESMSAEAATDDARAYFSATEAEEYRRQTMGSWDVYQCDATSTDHFGNRFRCNRELGHSEIDHDMKRVS